MALTSLSSFVIGNRIAAVAWIASALLTIPASAQLPHARLDALVPPGGRVGTEVEVQLQGVDLDEVDRLIFSHTGLTAAAKTESRGPLLPDPRPVPGTFLVAIDGDVPPGLYEVRAVGHFGISNSRWFHVDAYENALETSDNSVAEKAMTVSVGTTVCGRADGDRIDYFRFSARAGERITIDCLAERIDSRLDATLALYGPAGQEMGRVRDTHGHDPVLAFAAPADGDYTLAVYDFLYRGGNDYFYRLSIHHAPHLTHVFPPCIVPGRRAAVTVYGYNLPGGKPVDAPNPGLAALEQLDTEIEMPPQPALLAENQPGAWLDPSCSMLDAWLYRLDSPAGPSNPLMIGCAAATVVTELEPNDTPAQAAAVDIPCEYVGQLSTRGDRDWLTFAGRQGQVLWIEVISHRLGAPCDPVLHIEKVTVDSQGKEQVSRIVGLDDVDPPAGNNPARLLRARSDDPVYRLVVDQDATYRVQVRDLYGSPLAGSPMVYRLVVREPQPDFRLVAYPLPADRRDRNKVHASSAVLRRRGTAVFEVRCFRLDGFEGDVEVSVEGLPAGVSCSVATLGGTVDTAGLVLIADETAAAWAGTVKIVGHATVGGRPVERAARTAAVVVGSDNLKATSWVTRLTQLAGLSVTDSESAPASLTAGDGNVLEASIGGKLEVPLRADRRGEFAPAGNPVVEGLPAQVQVKAGPMAGDAGKLELNLANNQIPTGTYTFYVRAPVKQKRVRNAAAIATAEAELQRAEQIVKEKTELAGQVTEAGKAQAEQVARESQQLKAEADKRLNDIRNANKEREFTFELISTPVRLRVHATPIVVSTRPAAVEIRRGDKASVEVTVERKFGFDDKVDIVIAPPSGVPGMAAGPLSIAKGQAGGTLEITANDQARPGEYEFQLVGRVRFNNVNLEEKVPLVLRVVEP